MSDSDRLILKIKTGDSILVDLNNNMTSNIYETDLIYKTEDGIKVEDLRGQDGPHGGTLGCDNWTMKEVELLDSNNKKYYKLATNVDNVIYIYSICGYKDNVNPIILPTSNFYEKRNTVVQTDYKPTSYNMKSIEEIVAELNVNAIYAGLAPYVLRKGDLLMLRNNVHLTNFATIYGVENAKLYQDDGNRYPQDKCIALFIIDTITYDPEVGWSRLVTKLDMRCLWCCTSEDNVNISNTFTKGTTYSYIS